MTALGGRCVCGHLEVVHALRGWCLAAVGDSHCDCFRYRPDGGVAR